MNDWKCEHAALGCNYPESECAGVCIAEAQAAPARTIETALGTAKVLSEGEQEPVACPYCDNTGDVHSIDGEWRGECDECKPAPAVAVNEQLLEACKTIVDDADEVQDVDDSAGVFIHIDQWNEFLEAFESAQQGKGE